MNLKEIFEELKRGKIGITMFNNIIRTKYKVEAGIMFYQIIHMDKTCDEWEEVPVTDTVLTRNDFEIYEEEDISFLKEISVLGAEDYDFVKSCFEKHNQKVKEDIKKLELKERYLISSQVEELINKRSGNLK